MATDDPLYRRAQARSLATVKGVVSTLCARTRPRTATGRSFSPRTAPLPRAGSRSTARASRRQTRREAAGPRAAGARASGGVLRGGAGPVDCGRPAKRPDKEVERIFHQFCKTCDWFDPDKQICRGCGCRVAEGGYAVQNKIKMATENCPRDLW